MSCEMKQNDESEVQTRNDNEVLNHQTEGEEDDAEENSNKSEELKETNSNDSCEHLDDEAKPEKEELGGNENKLFSFFTTSLNFFCQISSNLSAGSLLWQTRWEKKQGEDISPEELKGDNENKKKQ